MPAAELLQLRLRTPLQPSPSSNWRLKPQDFWCGEDGNGDGEQEAAENGSGCDFWKPAEQTPELAGTHRTRQHMGFLAALAILAGLIVMHEAGHFLPPPGRGSASAASRLALGPC